MRHYGGFEPKAKHESIRPVPDYVSTSVTRDKLRQMFLELHRHRMSPRTVGMLRKLAMMTPALRTVVNLKVLLGLMAQGEVSNILVEGVTDDERMVLLEVAGSGLSSVSKETAHALFNMDVRLATLSELRPTFRRTRTAWGQELTEQEIDQAMKEQE